MGRERVLFVLNVFKGRKQRVLWGHQHTADSAAIQTEVERQEPAIKMGERQKPGCFFIIRLSHFTEVYSSTEVE